MNDKSINKIFTKETAEPITIEIGIMKAENNGLNLN